VGKVIEILTIFSDTIGVVSDVIELFQSFSHVTLPEVGVSAMVLEPNSLHLVNVDLTTV
jgi:hypothetical protein